MPASSCSAAFSFIKKIKSFIKDDDLPFVMELPPYRIPTAKAVFRHTWEKCKEYLSKIGGVILVCSIAIWFLSYFPNHDKYSTAEEQQENSFLGYLGKAVEPALAPLGFDWKMDIGILSGIGAKELIVSTLGIMYSEDDAKALKKPTPKALKKPFQPTPQRTPATFRRHSRSTRLRPAPSPIWYSSCSTSRA